MVDVTIVVSRAMDKSSCDDHQYSHKLNCLPCCYFALLNCGDDDKILRKVDSMKRMRDERVVEQLERRGYTVQERSADPVYQKLFGPEACAPGDIRGFTVSRK
jgi:hypothetical protein